mgnify:CR=1 FL=1|jgi:hypothetical protein
MIQRIQSIWLLLAGLTAMALFYTDIYRAEVSMVGETAVIQHLRVGEHFLSVLLAVLITLIPLVAIFLFKNRKRQRNIVWIGVLGTLALIGVNLMRVRDFTSQLPKPVNANYHLASLLPVAVLVFLILAIRGINKDEKLVRSLDRLR